MRETATDAIKQNAERQLFTDTTEVGKQMFGNFARRGLNGNVKHFVKFVLTKLVLPSTIKLLEHVFDNLTSKT